MYRELLSERAYNNTIEYAQLLAFAKAEYEEEVAEEEYKREYFNQIEPQERSLIPDTRPTFEEAADAISKGLTMYEKHKADKENKE